jgi:hypothetical protein
MTTRWMCREPGRYRHSSMGERIGVELTVVSADDRGDDG